MHVAVMCIWWKGNGTKAGDVRAVRRVEAAAGGVTGVACQLMAADLQTILEYNYVCHLVPTVGPDARRTHTENRCTRHVVWDHASLERHSRAACERQVDLIYGLAVRPLNPLLVLSSLCLHQILSFLPN